MAVWSTGCKLAVYTPKSGAVLAKNGLLLLPKIPPKPTLDGQTKRNEGSCWECLVFIV